LAQLLPFQERWIKENPLLGSRWFWHVLFWTTRVLLYGIIWGIDDFYQESGSVLPAIFKQLFALPAEMLLVYFTLYVLIPGFLLKRKYVQFFAYLVLAILLAGLLKRSIYYYLYYPYFEPGRDLSGYLAYYKIVQTAAFLNAVVVSAAIAIKLLKLWYHNQMTLRALVQEKLKAELNFLKAQIHPHFLFNTLNNIYGLALRQSEQTPQLVLKLSGLLHYMLYDCTSPQVSLKKEIEYVEDYIALEQMRFGERLDVSFQVRGDIHDKHIAPLVILTFVENGFKHGVNAQVERAWIKIDIAVKGNLFCLKMANSKPTGLQPSSQLTHQGIGLGNVKRRLELTYGDKYDLQIREDTETYEVSLQLNLTAGTHILPAPH